MYKVIKNEANYLELAFLKNDHIY